MAELGRPSVGGDDSPASVSYSRLISRFARLQRSLLFVTTHRRMHSAIWLPVDSGLAPRSIQALAPTDGERYFKGVQSAQAMWRLHFPGWSSVTFPADSFNLRFARSAARGSWIT